MPLHLICEGLVVSDADDPNAAVLQLRGGSGIFGLLFRRIVMRSVHEYADSREILAFLVEVRLDTNLLG